MAEVLGEVGRWSSYHSPTDLMTITTCTTTNSRSATKVKKWTAIGQWTGVPLSLVLDAVSILPAARFVVFYSYDDWIDCIDMLDALHPQTILAYGMNGRDLPTPHGAPVRLRVERQMGYKSMKYLRRIVVADEFDDGGTKGNIQNGWAWYTGI